MTPKSSAVGQRESGEGLNGSAAEAVARQFLPETDGTTELPLLVVFFVRGVPQGQAAIRYYNGHGTHQNATVLKPWREAVRHAAEFQMGGRPPFDEPLRLEATFTLPKPSSAPKRRTTWPDRRPDASHLLRAVEDAMTGVVYADDARLVEERVAKRYPSEGADALNGPGVLIRVWAVGRV